MELLVTRDEETLMPTKIKREHQWDDDHSREPRFADVTAGMDDDRKHYGSAVFGAVKFIALTLLAFLLTSIWVMSMPGLIDDKIETLYFRVGNATTVDLPSYVQPKTVDSEGTQTKDRHMRSTDFDFTPPSSDNAYITHIERFAENSASVLPRSTAFENLEVGVVR
jgi:hypothetical protein